MSGPRAAGGRPGRRFGARVLLVGLACAGCAPSGADQAPPRFELEGLDVRAFATSRPTGRLRADRLLVEPKRAGPFVVSALSELVLVRPRLDLVSAGSAGPTEAGSPPRTGPAGAGGLGVSVGLNAGLPLLGLGRTRHLVGATLHAPTLRFVQDGEPVAQVDAERGTARAGADEVVLYGFRLEHRASGRSVRARRAVWSLADATFWIAGEAEVQEGGRRSTLRAVRLGADGLAAGGR